MTSLLIPFITIALAEIGDKSQILVFLLASRTKKHIQLLLGVMLAFLVVDGFAILVGSWIVNLIPLFWLKIIAGSLFIILGLLSILQKEDKTQEKPELKNPFLSGFTLILLAEWGDKTQLASALFSVENNPIIVLISVISALLLLSILAIYAGKYLSNRINHTLTAKIAGAIFIIIGLLTLLQVNI